MDDSYWRQHPCVLTDNTVSGSCCWCWRSYAADWINLQVEQPRDEQQCQAKAQWGAGLICHWLLWLYPFPWVQLHHSAEHKARVKPRQQPGHHQLSAEIHWRVDHALGRWWSYWCGCSSLSNKQERPLRLQVFVDDNGWRRSESSAELE